MRKVFFVAIAVSALGFSSCKECGTCDTYLNGAKVSSTAELCGDDYTTAKNAATYSEALKSGTKCSDK